MKTDLEIAQACGPAFDTEARPQGRLTQSDHSLFAQLAKGLPQPYAGGSFPFSCRGRVDRSWRYCAWLRI